MHRVDVEVPYEGVVESQTPLLGREGVEEGVVSDRCGGLAVWWVVFEEGEGGAEVLSYLVWLIGGGGLRLQIHCSCLSGLEGRVWFGIGLVREGGAGCAGFAGAGEEVAGLELGLADWGLLSGVDVGECEGFAGRNRLKGAEVEGGAGIDDVGVWCAGVVQESGWQT